MNDMTVKEAARAILSRHGRVSADAVMELHDETGMGMCECKDALTALRTSVLESENAKLRELVRGLRWCHDKPWNEGACDQCPISGRAVGRCDRLVRELGIEDDGFCRLGVRSGECSG